MIIHRWCRIFAIVLSVSMGLSLSAGETVVVTTPQTQAQTVVGQAVVTINGEVITLGDLEMALLRQEGAELMESISKYEFENKDWAKLTDDQPVLSQRITRGQLTLELLRRSGTKVRGELVDIRLVEQAIAREGVVLDQRAIESELERMQKRLEKGLDKRGKQHADLRTIIQSQYDMSLERWVQQKGFRLLLGIHALLDHYAAHSISDSEVADYVAQHPERFRIQAAVDLAVLFLAHPVTTTADGRSVSSDQDRANTMSYMSNIYDQIRQGRLSFDQLWNTPVFGAIFQKGYQNSQPGGRIGWVLKNGQREGIEGRGVSLKSVEKSFASQGPWPVLLEPVAVEDGVELVLVHGKRATRETVLSEVAAAVRRDMVDETIEARQKRLMEDLARVSTIEYQDLTQLMKRRALELGISLTGPPSPAPSPAPDPAPVSPSSGKPVAP